MAAIKISKTDATLHDCDLTESEILFLVSSGLSKIQVANFIKKGCSLENIKKKLKVKVADNKAKQYLKKRLGKDLKMPEKSLPKVPDWKPKRLMQELKLKLPMLPSANHMYQTTTFGARQMTSIAKMMFLEIQDMIEEEIIRQNWEPVHNHQLIIEMEFYFPDKRMRDSHNMYKFLFDTMDGVAYDNDQYLLPHETFKGIDKEDPRINILLYIKDRPIINKKMPGFSTKCNSIVKI